MQALEKRSARGGDPGARNAGLGEQPHAHHSAGAPRASRRAAWHDTCLRLEVDARDAPGWVMPLGSREEAPSVTLVRADSVRLEPIHWLWPGFLPAGLLTVLAGAPGAGKTSIAMTLAATVTRGGRWPDGSRCEAPGDVLVWSGEDPPAVLAARLAASGADLSRVHFVAGADGGSFDPSRDVAALETAAGALPAPRLLIIDPIVSAVGGDSHKAAEVRRSLQPAVDLGHRLGCGVLGISHFAKSSAGRDPVERVIGSVAFAALARVVLVAAKDRAPEGGGEPRRLLLRSKSNIGPDDGGLAYQLERVEVAPGVEGQRVIWLGAVQGTARELLAEVEAPDDDFEAPTDVAAWLRDLLAAGPMPAREVRQHATDAGLSWRSVQRAMKRAGVGARREGFPSRTVWFLRPSRATVAPVAPTSECGATGANGANVNF
jgi:putative DNA primase/helicase